MVPTTDKYLGAEELAALTIYGSTGSKFNAPEMSADHSYVRFSRAGQSSDGNIYMITDNTAVTGKYMVFKYRTDHNTHFDIWANTESNDAGGGSAHCSFYTNVGNGWNIAIIDLSQYLPKYVMEHNGTYNIQWARFDVLDNSASKGYVDLAYVVYCDDITDILGIMQDNDLDLCPHIVAENPGYVDHGANHSTDCAVCGDPMFFNHSINGVPTWNNDKRMYEGQCICRHDLETETIYVAEPYYSGSISSFKGVEEDGYVKYTQTGTSDPYIHLYLNGSVVTGKYAIIKYRTTKNGAGWDTSFVGSVKGSHTAATSGCDSNTSSTRTGSFVGDGQWHYALIEAKSTCFVANDDGTYSYRFLRIDVCGLSVGDSIDIDEIAFVDCLQAAEGYIYSREPNTPFAFNIDAAIINGSKVAAGRVENSPYVIDMKGKPGLKDSIKGVTVHGWCVTPGGIEGYYIRVTTVDGEKVASPDNIRWKYTNDKNVEVFVGSTIAENNGIITTVSNPKGWTTNARYGAGFQSHNPIDLSAYEQSTISFEIVIKTIYGKEVVICQVNDLKIECNHETYGYSNVDNGVAATCTEAGYQAYKICKQCGEIVDTPSGYVVAAPVVIPALGHKDVDYAAKAPGIAKDDLGWDAYSHCAVCETYWNADGIVIPNVPYIDALTDIEIYLSPEALLQNINNFGANATISVLTDKDGTKYYRATPAEGKTIGTDGNLMFLDGNTKETGRYMIIKYRTNKTSSLESWANTTQNGHSGGSANHYPSNVMTDGTWHIMIYDWATIKPNHVKADANGKYIIQWSRVDIMNDGAAAGNYFDLAWVAYCDDLTDMLPILEDDQYICPHTYTEAGENCESICKSCGKDVTRHNNTETYTDNGNVRNYTVTCSTCKSELYTYSVTFGAEKPALYYTATDIYNKSYPGTRMGYNEVLNENGIEFVKLESNGYNTKNEGYFNIVPSSSNQVAGKYMVIKYRTNASNSWEIFAGDQRYVEAGKGRNFSVAPVANGQWQYMIIDLEAKVGDRYDRVDNVYHLGHMRLDIWNTPPKDARYIDIAFIAFDDDLSKIAAIDAEKTAAAHTCVNGSYYAYDDGDNSTFAAKKAADCLFCGNVAEVVEIDSRSHVSSFIDGADKTIVSTNASITKNVTNIDASNITATIVTDHKLRIYGWSVCERDYDKVAFRVLDENGNVLVNWTECSMLTNRKGPGSGANQVGDASTILSTAGIPGATIDMVHRHTVVADLSSVAGKTVTVEYAFICKTPTTGNDLYETYARVTNVAVPAAQ